MTFYEAASGSDRLLAMTTAFYRAALADDVIGEVFSRPDGDHARHLASWLAASFDGPQDYLRERGDLGFVIWQHTVLSIAEAQRARSAQLMMDAAAEVGTSEAFMRSFERFMDGVSRSVRQYSNEPLGRARPRLGLAPGGDMAPLAGG